MLIWGFLDDSNIWIARRAVCSWCSQSNSCNIWNLGNPKNSGLCSRASSKLLSTSLPYKEMRKKISRESISVSETVTLRVFSACNPSCRRRWTRTLVTEFLRFTTPSLLWQVVGVDLNAVPKTLTSVTNLSRNSGSAEMCCGGPWELI